MRASMRASMRTRKKPVQPTRASERNSHFLIGPTAQFCMGLIIARIAFVRVRKIECVRVPILPIKFSHQQLHVRTTVIFFHPSLA